MLQNPKKIAICFFMMVVPFFVHAQKPSDCYFKLYRHDVGIVGGATNYMGDFNERFVPLRQPSYYGGLMYRFHFNAQHSLRAQVSYGRVRGDAGHTPDALVDPSGNNWAFSCPIVFADAVAEIGFMPMDILNFRVKERFSPYLLLGVGYILRFADNNYASPLQNDKSNVTRQYFSIPLGVGVKYAFAPRYTVGLEWVVRKTFIDDMDNYNDVTPQGSSLLNTDWLCNIGVTLTYRLPENRNCAAYSSKKKKAKLAAGMR